MKKWFLFLAATAAQEVTKSLRTYVRSMFFKNALHGYARDQKGSSEYRQVFIAQGPDNQLFWSCFSPLFVPRGLRPA